MYKHTSLTVLLIIMPGWEGASKNNLASVILQSTKKLKVECLENLSLCWSKLKYCKVAETLPKNCLSDQPCKLGSPLSGSIKEKWLSYTKSSLESIILQSTKKLSFRFLNDMGFSPDFWSK